MVKILSLIDSDGLIYHSSRNTLEESILTLNEKIQNIYEKTQCTHAAFFISKGKYFRHEISNGTYKSNRNKYTSPFLLQLSACITYTTCTNKLLNLFFCLV